MTACWPITEPATDSPGVRAYPAPTTASPVKTSHLVPLLGVLALVAGACDAADTAALPDAGADSGDRCDVRYADLDGDRKGDPSSWTTACAPGPGWVDNSDDCDDHNPYVNADEAEICDGVDNDCRATTGEAALCEEQRCRSAVDPVTRTSYLFCAPRSHDEAPRAGDVCGQYGFRPAQIEDAAEDQRLSELIVSLAGPGAEGVVVLGGTYADGVWRWADDRQFWPDPHDGATAPYAGWLDGEPSPAKGEQCMGLNIGRDLGWVTVPCRDRNPIACERASAP
jgi:hypothetical protein